MITLFITGLVAPTLTSAAPTPGQAFYLHLSSSIPLLSGAVLRDNNTYDFGVTPAPYYNNPPYGDHPSPISVSSTNPAELIVSPTNPHPGPISGRLSLVSAGPGDWTLSKAFSTDGVVWNVGPGREDAVVKVYEWGFEDSQAGATVLRWKEGPEGRWIAVKGIVEPWEGAAYERWVVHWLEGMFCCVVRG